MMDTERLKNNDDDPARIENLCVKKGMRMTDQRRVIARILSMAADHPDVEVLVDIYTVAQTCSKSKFWSSQINQLYVNRDKEIELIPRVGDHHILIGHSNDLDKKLNKLKYFYAEGLDKTGWNEYKVINLKYANQVVCTKS